MENVIADIGNAQIKGKRGKSEEIFQHAIVQLRHDQWEAAIKRSRHQHDDLVMVNGTPYAISARAEQYDIPQRLTGANRYTPEYYGVLVAILLAKLLKNSTDEVYLFGSYPPGDWMYTDDLLNAAAGRWEVTYRDKAVCFDIVDGSVFEEPLGGLMNVMLKEDGRLDDQFRVIAEGVSLVIDIGGHTTDTLRIEPNGYVDEQSAQSVNLGILKALRGFEENIRANHAALLKGVELDAEVIRDALRTCKLNLRGHAGYVDVTEESDFACNQLVSSVTRIFRDTYGGAARFDTVILTGGGGSLLETRLKRALGHRNVRLAEKRGKMHLANVRGGAKLLKLYERNGGL